MTTSMLPISPKILRWARETAGLTAAEAAEKLGVETDKLKNWESISGAERPGITVIRKMVTIYRRSPTVFLLPEPPQEKPLPKDFRTIGGADNRLTSAVLFAIRDAAQNRFEVGKLVEADPTLLVIRRLGNAHLDDAPSHHAAIERKRLNVSFEDQLGWSRAEVFKRWRAAVERLGVLVFLKKMPEEDCLGFSLLDANGLPTIVVNSAFESEEARSFTLFHEYAHLILKQEGICSNFAHAKGKVEPWCNKFAGDMLIPEKIITRLRPDLEIGRKRQWDFDELTQLARQLRVSRQALAIRLQDLGLAPTSLYSEVEHQLKLEKEAQKPKPKTKVIIPQHIKAVSASGKTTASVVMGALDRGSINVLEASAILNLSARYFGSLRKIINYGARSA